MSWYAVVVVAVLLVVFAVGVDAMLPDQAIKTTYEDGRICITVFQESGFLDLGHETVIEKDCR